ADTVTRSYSRNFIQETSALSPSRCVLAHPNTGSSASPALHLIDSSMVVDSDWVEIGVEGKVALWFSDKGYGFIEVPGKSDVFVHFRSINADGYRSLFADQRVTCDLEQERPGKYKAVNVTPQARLPLSAINISVFEGTVTLWNDAKGFGIIRTASFREDSIVFHSDVQRKPKSRVSLKPGQRVQFKVVQQADQRLRAIQVLPLPHKLLHLTRYKGRFITPRRIDRETPNQPLIWMQCCSSTPCCPRFGDRQVECRPAHLLEVAPSWTLWHVSTCPGTNPSHHFVKLALAPAGIDLQIDGFKPVRTIAITSLRRVPPELFGTISREFPPCWGQNWHWHIGVMISKLRSF
ncbi:MAG: hypothetical protein SGPRY_008825, partial [Prymnesium sp.]